MRLRLRLRRLRLLAFTLGLAVDASCGRGNDDASRAANDTSVVASPDTPSHSVASDTGPMLVTPRGLGGIVAGMSLADASAIAGETLGAPASPETGGCGYASWRGAPRGVRVMVQSGRVARVDVTEPGVATELGARVGDTEERIKTLYAGRVRQLPHKYTDGHYLIVTPAAPADSNMRIVFETDGRRVTRYRSGRRPEVEYVEGCA